MDETSKGILQFWKAQRESYMKSMTAVQEQGRAMLEMLRISGVRLEGSQKMVKDWADQFKAIQKTCFNTVEEPFKKLEDILEPKK